MLIQIYTDGASRNNPGKSASGYQVYDTKDNLLLKNEFYNGIATNNEAEYYALIASLNDVAQHYGYSNDLDIYSDSQLMIRQLKGSYKTKNKKLRELNSVAKDLLSKFLGYELHSVLRSNRYIKDVDKQLNLLLDKMKS